jgi:ABC-type nickel/cobalt efflux system permease component RcnA
MVEEELHTQRKEKKSFNLVVILGAWILWKHRNACVFQEAQSSTGNILQKFHDKQHFGACYR